MNMNPWQVEQLVAGRRDEFERAADRHRDPLKSSAEASALAPAPRPRPAVARHVGILLIAVGHRLAHGEPFPAAFHAAHR